VSWRMPYKCQQGIYENRTQQRAGRQALVYHSDGLNKTEPTLHPILLSGPWCSPPLKSQATSRGLHRSGLPAEHRQISRQPTWIRVYNSLLWYCLAILQTPR
jgi:hypothetical protein